MENLYEIDQLESLSKIGDLLEKDKKINLTNVKGGLQVFIAYLVYEQAKEKKQDVLYIVPSEKEARDKYRILNRFIENVSIFSPEETHLYFSDAFSMFGLQTRETALKKALTECPLLTIAPIDALMKKLPNPEDIINNNLFLKVGNSYEFDEIVDKLVSFGYERSELTETVGQFSVRGGIIDIFPISEASPIRIDFFDDDIESITYFNEVTQRSEKEIDSINLSPLSEDWINPENREVALEKIKEKYNKEEKFAERIELAEENSFISNGIISAFSNNNDDLIEYLKFGSNGRDPIIIWAEPEVCKEHLEEYLEKIKADFQALSLEGEVFPDEINRYFTMNQLITRFNEYPLLKLHLFTDTSRKEKHIDLDSKIIENFAGQPKLLADFLKNRLNHDYFIRIFTKNKVGETSIENLLKDYEISYITDPYNKNPGIRLSQGEITESFELAQDKILFLNESDFFKSDQRQAKKKKNATDISRFAEIKKGDLVVHDKYGIGRYTGLTQVNIGDSIQDMMRIEYANDDVLYIPVNDMDLVQAYIGTGEDTEPPLNEIGNKKWERTKAKAKKAADDMAAELIELYSQRQQTQGYSYSPDTVWQQQFEDAFPYEETPDQLQSLTEIKADMEKDTVMDRLLCGDVGFGKTEVAFRAAFKAIMDHKQVALLVPTTVLSQQHYLLALERFKDFPINIEVLNRFKTPKEAKDIIRRLENGEVDMIIGTHRILSKDINFKDLGLLIIDEEQRFGVRSKEKIKQLKENIDVLTLSATPIPRTLHMSLIDVRDMSVLEEPPEGRKPVQTYVMKYNPAIIKDAIKREINRNGQVYYIHNRVHNIDEVVSQLRELVPEARIVSAHGQMSGRELENVMVRFLNKEYDVLVATTIVENGLDVQNANTMIIEDGDHFGLSQLYQLRGRVGRSQRQAYTYITHKKEQLKGDAKKRLKALRDFTSFGSGFKVAMRDLEIRGAGNILGSQQSGHMFNIGYELYNRILRQAITEKLTGIPEAIRSEASIKTSEQAYVPAHYIVGDEIRYDIYKKISRLYTFDDYNDLVDELKDRFGEIPQEVINLMFVSLIKNSASELGIQQVTQNENEARIVFSSQDDGQRFNRYFKKSDLELKNLRINKRKQSRPIWDFELSDSKNLYLRDLFKILSTINNTRIKLQGEKN